MAKLNKTQQWAQDLEAGTIKLWEPGHTRSVLTAVRNTSKRYSVDEVQALLNTAIKPVRVNGHLEGKAANFWRTNCYTNKGAWRDTEFTRVLGMRERGIVDLYLNQKAGDCSKGHHYFVDLHDVTTPNLYTYFKGHRNVIPVYRLSVQTADGTRHFDYSYGSWQSGALLEIAG